jgi:hypothetical protein
MEIPDIKVNEELSQAAAHEALQAAVAKLYGCEWDGENENIREILTAMMEIRRVIDRRQNEKQEYEYLDINDWHILASAIYTVASSVPELGINAVDPHCKGALPMLAFAQVALALNGISDANMSLRDEGLFGSEFAEYALANFFEAEKPMKEGNDNRTAG